MKAKRVFYIILAAALLCLRSSGYAGATESFPPLPKAVKAMKSGPCLSVKTVTVPAWGEADNYYYAFQARFKKPTCGFIFYPGAFVDPQAYAPSMREIAEAGYLAVIVKMPDDLAILGVERATDIIAKNPAVEKWVIGGHSLGATCACIYTYEHPGTIKGLAVWASIPDPARPLTDFTGRILSIYGTNDSKATDFGDLKDLLPADTRYVVIQGGNHTYCGWYDTSPNPLQPGDNPATITHEEQQAQLDNATLVLLDEVSGRQPSNCPVVAVLGRDNPAVAMLRQFRDSVLVQNAVGCKVIQIYYNNAGSINAALERSPALRAVTGSVLIVLAPLVGKNYD
jgi:hypothetical protein